jgi:hypothetical protein
LGIGRPEAVHITDFYNVHHIDKGEFNANINTGHELYKSQLELTPIVYKHERCVYTFFDVIADLGGVMEIILAVFAILIVPYTQLSFNVEAIQTFYQTKNRVNRGPEFVHIIFSFGDFIGLVI